MNRLLIAMSSTLILGACATSEPPMEAPMAPMAPMADASSPLAAPTYVQMAASSDLFEIQSGQLAGQMSQNPAVRNFGNLLVAHHSHTTAQLTAAAQSAGLPPPPPALMPNHQAMLDQLRAAGPNFDVAFRDMQIQAHQEALALHQNYANGGDQPALRQVAAAAVPIVQQHLTIAQSLNIAPAGPPPAQNMQNMPAQGSGERG